MTLDIEKCKSYVESTYHKTIQILLYYLIFYKVLSFKKWKKGIHQEKEKISGIYL